MGVNLPSSLEDDLWHWKQLFEDLKDDLREGTKGNIGGATDTLEAEIVTEDYKDRGAKPGATAPSFNITKPLIPNRQFPLPV